jgi:threonine/homoserine/homoserine lactone efflux protein
LFFFSVNAFLFCEAFLIKLLLKGLKKIGLIDKMTASPFIIGVSLVWVGFLIGLSGALIPGPLFAFVISDTLKKGALSGPLTIIGHISVECPVIVLLLALGVKLENYFTQFESLIYVIGGIALLLMSLFIIKEAKAAKSRLSVKEIDKEVRMRREKYNSSIFGGFLLTAFNPSFIPWWLTAGWMTLMAGLKSPIWNGVLLVILGHFLSDFAWYSLVSFSFSKGKNFFIGKKYELAMLIIAIFLIALSILFVICSQVEVPYICPRSGISPI